MQTKRLVLLVDGALQEPRPDKLLLGWLDGMLCCLAPVLVDSVLEEDDGEQADRVIQGLVKEDALDNATEDLAAIWLGLHIQDGLTCKRV